MSFEFGFKYVIVGDSGVGKSCVLLQLTSKRFQQAHELTIGADYGYPIITLNNNKAIKLQIWDTAGQETFRSLAKSYYRGVAGALIVYDITRLETFRNVENFWLQEVMENKPDAIVLVGNKFDLAHRREVSTNEAQEFADKHGMIFMETSAKTAHNIEQTFRTSAQDIYDKIQKGVLPPVESQGIKLGPQAVEEHKIRVKNKNKIRNRLGCCNLS